MQSALKWIYDHVNKLLYWVTAFLVLLMVINVFTGVIYRYVLNNAIYWTEELARYLMIWMGYLAMSMVIRGEENVSVSFVLNWLPVKARRFIKVLGHLAIGVFLAIVFRESLKYMRILRIQTTPALQLPMAVPYLSVTVGAALMFLENFVLLVAYTIGKKPDTACKKEV